VTFFVCILCDRAGIDDEYVGSVGEVYFAIAFFFETPGDGGGFGVVEFATQGIKSDFLHEPAKLVFFGRMEN